MIQRNLCNSHMTQNISRGQQAFFFLQYSTQQIVGINESLHQNICLACTYQFNSQCGRLVGSRSNIYTDKIGRSRMQAVCNLHMRLIGDQEIFCYFFTQATNNNVFRMRVIGTYHSNPPADTKRTQIIHQLGKGSNQFHTIRFLANMKNKSEFISIFVRFLRNINL